MTKQQELRQFPKAVKRVVVKVGSGQVADYSLKPRNANLRNLVDQICRLQEQGIEIVLVSSGAIALGMGEVGLQKRPADLASLQALASIGQTILMRNYKDLFKKHESKCSQILLTWDDFDNRIRYNNVRGTIEKTLEWGIVPVINENDTISTEEIKFGDNDRLSSLVASLIDADLLVILSDVEGLYDLNSPDRKMFEEVKEITKEIEQVASGTLKKNVSKGGMISKISAIKIATQAQVPCIIANGQQPDVLVKIAHGEKIGTYFFEKEEKLLARKHWISFGVKPKGSVIVDDGASKALIEKHKSLLLPGIMSWEGDFKKDDVVLVKDPQGKEIARGIINYSNSDLHRMTAQDKKGKFEAIHRNDMVISEQ